MYSSWSDSSNRRQYSDRSSRQLDDYDERWEDRREPRREIEQNTYHKYSGDGHSSSGRTSRSREYSDSPKRPYNRDSLNRERSRKSPVRRRTSSSDWGASEKKRRQYTDNDEGEYGYRCEPEDIKNSDSHSPESLSRSHVTSDYKCTLPLEEDFKCRRKSQDSRHKYQQEDFSYRQQHNDATNRRSTGYYDGRDNDENRWDYSQERRRSQEQSTKSYARPRERDDSPTTDHGDHHLDRTRFSLNGSEESFKSDVTNQGTAAPNQTKSARGFQRFLDVLNKGVDAALLTKMVTQMSPEQDHHQSNTPTSFMNTADRAWSPPHVEGQQETYQNTSYWSEREHCQRRASPQPCHRSVSPKRHPLSDEMFLQGDNKEQSFFSSNNIAKPQVEKVALRPEDEHEHKHRQVQDVLQAIGINLGFEELGQMSHRIQERLYGKKDGDRDHDCRENRERHSRQVYSPRLHSRSSSSRSSLSPPTQEYCMKKNSYSAQRDPTEIQHAADYSKSSSSSSALQETEKSETNSQQSSAACPTFSQKPTNTVSQPSTPPVMPMYSAVQYPALTPQAPGLASTLSPALPPYLSNVGTQLFLPRQSPLVPFPIVQPMNSFQQSALLAQTRHLLPQHMLNPQPPFFNMANVNPIQPLNNTKSKTMSRPRCLQVIDTKLPS